MDSLAGQSPESINDAKALATCIVTTALETLSLLVRSPSLYRSPRQETIYVRAKVLLNHDHIKRNTVKHVLKDHYSFMMEELVELSTPHEQKTNPTCFLIFPLQPDFSSGHHYPFLFPLLAKLLLLI